MRNTASPLVSQLFQRALMTGYYIIQLRLLIDQNRAQDLTDYIFAGIVLMYASTISDWGLGTLLTREIATVAHRADPAPAQAEAQERALFGRMLGLRLGLSVLALVPIGLIAFFEPVRSVWDIGQSGSWALFLIGLSLIPNAFAASATALYNARERMALPALIQIVTAIINVTLGILALLLGWGAMGLGAAALLTTCCTALIFWRLMSRDFFAPSVSFDPITARALLIQAFPLMVNGLLIAVFFRFDQVIIKAVVPDDVTKYENAYKFINVTQIIAPSVVLALFPRMARAALHDRTLLTRQFRGAVLALLMIGLPLVAVTVVLAEALITFITLGKEMFLPGSAYALMILIWYLPLSFINGVAQYVLISLDRQRLLTWAIAGAALFNVVANLIAVPLFGMYGAAVVTIISEIVLLVPFMTWSARELGWSAVLPGAKGMRLGLAGIGLFAVAFGLNSVGVQPLLAAGAGITVYLVLLFVLGVISQNETALLRRVLGRGQG